MNNELLDIYDNLKNLEIELAKSFPILPGYLVVVNANKLNAILKQIYETLPKEIIDAKDFLNQREHGNIHGFIRKFEALLALSFPVFPNFLIAIKLRDFEGIIDKIYANLPTELAEAKKYLGVQ